MGIKCFLFDCGGVLLRDGDLSAYAHWEERLSLGAGELADRLWNGELWTAAAEGRLTDSRFWTEAGNSLGITDADQVSDLREDLWGTWAVDQNVLAVIDTLRARHKVAMLSNATDALEALLESRYQVADRFALILNSARLGMAKPEPAIYELAVERLGVAPGEIIFIDDRAENVAAAASAGMHVVWYVGCPELVRQLAPYLGPHGGRPMDPGEARRAELSGAPAPGHLVLAD